MERWPNRLFVRFWKDGLLAELQAKGSRACRDCRFLLFWHHNYQVTLNQSSRVYTFSLSWIFVLRDGWVGQRNPNIGRIYKSVQIIGRTLRWVAPICAFYNMARNGKFYLLVPRPKHVASERKKLTDRIGVDNTKYINILNWKGTPYAWVLKSPFCYFAVGPLKKNFNIFIRFLLRAILSKALCKNYSFYTVCQHLCL